MEKKILIILIQLFCFYSYLPAIESTPDSISTVYADGKFVTQYKTKFKATNRVVNDVSENLISDFHYSPANLFDWALKDLGLQEKKDNELTFIIKPSNFDEKTGITYGNFDIIVPHITTFKNVKVNAIVAKKTHKGGEVEVSVDVIYSSLFLKSGLGTLTIIPQRNNEQLLITHVSIHFGWFFNLFITKKRYKTILEWRIKRFAENIKKECEKRQENTSD